MNNKLLSLVILAVPLSSSCKNQKEQAKDVTSHNRPNIVLIFADDMGYGDIQKYNPTSKFPTPNLNSLAESGMCFKDAHTNSAVCSPSRYGILTGRYA